ncbi:MAG: terminase small subunit [bacterium]
MRCQKENKTNGEQCRRNAEPNSKYCWQHQPDCEDVGGARPEFETVAEMQKAIDDYFDSCFITATNEAGEEYQKRIRPWTITGLAYHLGVTRQTLLNYQNEYDEKFFATITRAKTRIEMYNEEQLHRGQGKTNGVQFNLMNNFNWRKKQEVDHGLKDVSSVEIELVDDES